MKQEAEDSVEGAGFRPSIDVEHDKRRVEECEPPLDALDGPLVVSFDVREVGARNATDVTEDQAGGPRLQDGARTRVVVAAPAFARREQADMTNNESGRFAAAICNVFRARWA